MTESEKKMVSEMLDRIYAVQSKATSDHSPGAGMVRGAFGEYLLLSAFQDLLRTLLFNANGQCKNCGGLLDDLIDHQKRLNRSLSEINRLRAERDRERITVCRLEAEMRGRDARAAGMSAWFHSPQQIAEERGWDCFDRKNKEDFNDKQNA